MTIRLPLPTGRGFHLSPDEDGGESWPWDHHWTIVARGGKVRVLATGLFGAEADRVALMSPAEAREWLAQRVAATPVPTPRSATGRQCRHRPDGDASACDHCCMFG